ncbi:hypothetical protein [Ferrovibrio sp.]|uniref:hypothetical protein n=1 Tax=Ferrovibrio sp. TaxID=1917215 RepID=UPI003D0A3F2C
MPIFEMWNRPASDFQAGDRYIHPADKADVEEIFDYHRPYLNTFPAPFWGPLRTAKLVLAYAGPGNTENDEDDDRTQAANPVWRNARCASFDGVTPFDAGLHHGRALRWFKSRARKVLGEDDPNSLDKFADQIAFAELTAYRGPETKWREVAFLPTTQAMRTWARTVLFPEAEERKRVVLIMRAHQWWGVRKTPAWGRGHLYAPETNRSGFLVNACGIGQQARQAARVALGLPV